MTTILHFSDVHFAIKRQSISFSEIIRPKRMLAAVNYLLRRRPKFIDADKKWQAFMDFYNSGIFDTVICTGDLSGMGMSKELSYAHTQVTAITQHPAFILLPGNHDLYLPEKDNYDFFDIFKDYLPVSDIPSPSDTTYPAVKFIGDNMVVIAVNSAKPNPSLIRSSGRVSDKELHALEQLLKNPEITSKKIVVATHYNVDDDDTNLHGLENRKAFRELLVKYNCTMLLHGHIHKSSKYTIPGSDIPVFCAGSLTYKGRESFMVHSLSDTENTTTPYTWNGTEFTACPPYTW